MTRLARVIAVGVPHHIISGAMLVALSCKTNQIGKFTSICYDKVPNFTESPWSATA
jgi:hypothetical protein